MPADADQARRGRPRWRPTRRPGARVPVQDEAGRLAAPARSHLAAPGGRVVVLRLRRRHRRRWPPARSTTGCAPTAATTGAATRSTRLGQQDITCEVCVDQLARVRPPARRAQPGRLPRARTASTSWWTRAAAVWAERAHVGDLEALRARSRVERGRGPRSTPPASAPSGPRVGGPERTWPGSRRSLGLPQTGARDAAPPGGLRAAALGSRPTAPSRPLLRSRTTCPRTGPSRRRDEFKEQSLVAGTVPLRRGRPGLRGVLGPPGRATCSTGTASGTRSSSGTCPSPSGSSAARSTSPTTASTATSRPAGATRSRSTGRASRATPAPSPTPTCCAEVQRFANVLKGLGVEQGDRVAIYMPMIPELPVAMLACARIGAAHSVVFGGFSADSLSDRINDAEAKVLITADGGWRRGQAAPAQAERRRRAGRHARRSSTSSSCSAPARRATIRDPDDRGPRPLVPRPHGRRPTPTCPAEPMDSEDLLYLLYTSGTTAKPKGIMHTTGGYLTQVAFTHKYVFDLHPETDVYWCAADIGWVTGHSYIVYGPLANGATSVMYEGTPDTPSTRPVVVDRREVRRHDPLHRADRHPDVHEVGDRACRPPTTCRRCGCSARSASPSTPRPGSGTARTSAATAARSSTRGGRPRPAPS